MSATPESVPAANVAAIMAATAALLLVAVVDGIMEVPKKCFQKKIHDS
jgi:hypothetical protein